MVFIKRLSSQIFCSFDIWRGIMCGYIQHSWIVWPNYGSFTGQFPSYLLCQQLSLSCWDWKNATEHLCSTERKQEWTHCPADLHVLPLLYTEPLSKPIVRISDPWRCEFSAWTKHNNSLLCTSWIYLANLHLPFWSLESTLDWRSSRLYATVTSTLLKQEQFCS